MQGVPHQSTPHTKRGGRIHAHHTEIPATVRVRDNSKGYQPPNKTSMARDERTHRMDTKITNSQKTVHVKYDYNENIQEINRGNNQAPRKRAHAMGSAQNGIPIWNSTVSLPENVQTKAIQKVYGKPQRANATATVIHRKIESRLAFIYDTAIIKIWKGGHLSNIKKLTKKTV